MSERKCCRVYRRGGGSRVFQKRPDFFIASRNPRNNMKMLRGGGRTIHEMFSPFSSCEMNSNFAAWDLIIYVTETVKRLIFEWRWSWASRKKFRTQNFCTTEIVPKKHFLDVRLLLYVLELSTECPNSPMPAHKLKLVVLAYNYPNRFEVSSTSGED